MIALSPVALALESGLALLLLAVLFFCWRLDRKLAALRAGQDGVREAAVELREASAHAELAVRNLRAAAQETGRDLQARIEEARRLSDTLGAGRGRADAQRPGRAW